MNSRFSRNHVLFAAFLCAAAGFLMAVPHAVSQQYYGTPPAGTGRGVPNTGGATYAQPASGGTYTPAAPGGTTYPNTGAPAMNPPGTTPAGGYPQTPTAGNPTTPGGAATADVRVIKAPFELTPEQQRDVDAILTRWEQFSLAVNSFQADFVRFKYVIAFGGGGGMTTIQEKGELRYQSPDCGMFAVTDMAGKPEEKWLCDGASIYEYKYTQKEIQQHILPEEMRGKGITRGPMPFLFGASAATLKQRYFIRRVTPPEKSQVPGQVWIEAFPRTVDDAQDFQRAEMIIALTPQVRPVAIKLHKANSEQHAYLFVEKTMKINPKTLVAPSWKPTREELRDMRVILQQ